MSKKAPNVVATVTALVVIFDFFFKQKTLNQVGTTVINWAVVVSAFALGLASVNLARTNIAKIVRRDKDWYASVVLLAFIVGIVTIGIVWSPSHPYYTFWLNNVYNACNESMTSILAFFIATASYRAFRLRTLEIGILLVSATVMMLGQAPVGRLIFAEFPTISKWLMDVVNLAGQRGIMITAGLGAIGASLRVLLGIERS